MSSPEFKPVKSKRLFAAGRRYDQIDWQSVIDAFRDQMETWYLRPVRVLRSNGDHSFAALSLCCTLVDTLSQYHYGVEEGTKKEFKDFLDAHFPGFSASLSAPIRYTFKGSAKTAATFSDVLYSGFRCGIVHEAHSKLYTGIWGTGQMVKEEPTGYTTYPDGSDCPTVIVDPGLFHDHSWAGSLSLGRSASHCHCPDVRASSLSKHEFVSIRVLAGWRVLARSPRRVSGLCNTGRVNGGSQRAPA